MDTVYVKSIIVFQTNCCENTAHRNSQRNVSFFFIFQMLFVGAEKSMTSLASEQYFSQKDVQGKPLIDVDERDNVWLVWILVDIICIWLCNPCDGNSKNGTVGPNMKWSACDYPVIHLLDEIRRHSYLYHCICKWCDLTEIDTCKMDVRDVSSNEYDDINLNANFSCRWDKFAVFDEPHAEITVPESCTRYAEPNTHDGIYIYIIYIRCGSNTRIC